ncbi:hypothetical protein BDQ17DRAFT_1232733 [Cyathus striatus]|nr:hypothetical protein BDQ17DRAFT_1232733 [Cyathus striatus]
MKILHKSKKVVTPPPQVADLIAKLFSTPTDQLANVLGEIDSWKWPRSDLNAWIKVLNKFDGVLEDIIQGYDVNTLQLKPFSSASKKLVSEILRFERLLLENSTNRKTFSSYDRLNSLLFTSDLDVLILALYLLLRPSQQYSAQPQVSHALNISTPRLLSLARRWPSLREYGVGLLDLVSKKGALQLENLPAETREVNFTFYKTSPAFTFESSKSDAERLDTSHNSPRKPSAPSPSAAIAVRINEPTLLSKPLITVLGDVIDEYSVPDEEKYELFCRMRAAASLHSDRGVEREKLVVARLLAIAIYGHTHPESQATSSLFLYEPDLITHIAELLQVDHGISVRVQTAAISALDAMARYRNKMQEVLTAVNAGVNHGILMALFRKMVSDVTNPNCEVPHAFVDALLSFVTFIASHASGGNMVVGAGLVPLLIQLIDNKLRARLPVISKTMQLVDNVLYSFTNAFNLFCSARGVEVLVGRIEYEIDLDIGEYSTSTQLYEVQRATDLPITRIAVLKHLLRSMHRMMQSSGTAEGLRGLVDMTLIQSIKKIIEHRGLFGSSIFPIAINIMATFVHNEPTSLAIIQEVGLPESFYKAIESGIEPAIEVIQAIPNAIGALCLNEIGQAQLARYPSIIPAVFSIFTSEKHLKVLIDKENAVLIGTAVDELIRHHPSLKTPVFESLRSTLSKIEELGQAYKVPHEIRQWYYLMSVEKASLSDEDIAMRDHDQAGLVSEAGCDPQPFDISEDDENNLKPHDNNIVSFIDIFGRFLEGLFQHTPHCRDFIGTTDGLLRLGQLTSLPCLPYDFANSVASDSMVQVMRTMSEVAASETLLHLAGLVKESLEDTRSFWETMTEQSKLLSLVDILESQQDEANSQFRNLVTLHIRITLLSDVFATAGYAHGRSAIGLLQTLMSNTSPHVVSDLGALHRASTWENIALNAGLIAKGISVQPTPSSSPLEGSPNPSSLELPDIDRTMANGPSGGTNGVQRDSDTGSSVRGKQLSKDSSSRDLNAAALKHLTHGLPNALAPFFQAMVKMFHARRNSDPAQKKQISESSLVVADIMLQHLKIQGLNDIPSLYTYYSVILGLFTLLLVDERTSTNTLHTVQLLAFYNANGMDAIFTICKSFMSTIDAIVKLREEDRTELQKKELLHAFGGIKVALHLLQPIISSKPLIESGQTFLMMTRDKKDTDPEYFEPHNFLVRLRLSVLPLVRSLWEAPWLLQAPLGVSRSVVNIVLELVNAENEDPKRDTPFDPNSGANIPPRPTGPEEAHVRMLTDMGFPRSAAERALVRNNNNVSAATDYLLLQPPFPPDPEPATLAAGEESTLAEQSVAAVIDNAEDSDLISNENVEQTGKGSEEWKRELDEAREPLRGSLSRQALLLIDEHQSLLFDLHVAFVKPNDSHQQQAVKDLVDDVQTFSPFAYDVQEQPLANRCRLLALVLCETPSSVKMELRNILMDRLLALLLSSIDPEHPPKWLAAHLLVMEALFTLADEPTTISLPKEGDAVEPILLTRGACREDSRQIVFNFCMRLLSVEDIHSDELLSALRLLVLFTRDNNLKSLFLANGLENLFKRIKVAAITGSSSYIVTILRHLVEDSSMISQVMRQAVKRYFSQPRKQNVDASVYVRNCSAMALRDPELFIDITKSLCLLDEPYSPSPQLNLKKEETTTKDKAELHDIPMTGMDVDLAPSTSSSNPTKSMESVVYLLIGEVMSTTKIINDSSGHTSVQNESTASQPDFAASSVQLSQHSAEPGVETEPSARADIDIYDTYQYLCFLMQCLTELLFSYDSCKIAFLSYTPKKRSQTPAKEPPNKFRTSMLQFLLSELITFGTINPDSGARARNRTTLCNWAMSVVVALCVDTSTMHDTKDVSADLASVRKFVLETISRNIKDVPVLENLDARYGRLLALAELCHRLLIVRFGSVARKQQEETPTHIAKVMLEKNFVATLTTALSDIDLNYPHIRSLVISILRPLEHLTKVAIKMSKASSKSKEMSENVEHYSTSSMSSSDDDDDDIVDEDREETPDLYRNSALGMYGGEMDDRNFDDDDEMDEDDDGDEDDVDMDFGDETGSEDTSNTDEGEDNDLGDEVHDSGDTWDEVDEDEEGMVENNIDEDEDEDEDDPDDEDQDDEGEGGDDGDEEMMWEDVNEDEDPLGTPGVDLGADEDRGVPIQIIHDDDDEQDMASDEEEYAIENGGFSVDDVFNAGDAAMNNTRDGSGLFVPRRHRGAADDSIQVFGRARNASTAPPEATTHPLLLDNSPSGTRNPMNQNRTRPPQRIVAAGSTDLFQTIEELISGGSLQLFQRIMARGRGGGGPDTFRLDVPAGALVDFERGLLQHRRFQPGVFSASIRLERAPRPQSQKQGREFDPLLTLQRWGEEAKILHGDFVNERAGKLTNYVILALLPTAIEAAKLAKLKKEEDAKQIDQQGSEEPVGDNKSSTNPLPEEVSGGAQAEDGVPRLPVEDRTDSVEDAVMIDVGQGEPQPLRAEESLAPLEENPAEESSNQQSIPERVTVMIHGSAVDITDTGIDPTFLEALPDDMREEVINQHVRDQRAARVERPPDSQISSEFLDALPPDIRAEIIQQEAMERARIRTDETHVSTTRASDIDPASFIASLDPSLRQAVLMDQDDGFLQTLPSHIIANAATFRDGHHARRHVVARSSMRNAPPGAVRKVTQSHDAIQLLDKTGVAVLVRLLFFPHVLKKTLLFKVLVNLCENAKTRTELFNLLLNILQDGTGDLAAVDKSFSQLSFKNSASKPQTPKSAGKQKANDYLGALALPNSQVEVVPDLIAQRCLEALTYIVSSNELSSLFFLTEHELPVGLRRTTTKKGKGKEKQVPQTHYPIVLLLGLLDRQSLLRTPSIMESVVSLLATVTRPLTSLKERQIPLEQPTPASEEAASIEHTSGPVEESSQSLADTITTGQAENARSGELPTAPDKEKKVPIVAMEEKILLANPPQVPHAVLRLIVNILTVGECSGRTFQQSLALIQHLSFIPDARDVVANELKSKAQEFGQALYNDLDELAVALQSSESELLVNSVATKFSPASSTQAKLLRVLKTIDYIYTPKNSSSESAGEEDIEKVQSIYDSFRFTPLWRRLGDCLSVIEENPDTEHVATVLLPLIEALMVVCKYVGSKGQSSTARTLRASASPRSPATARESMEDLFITFTDAHRKVLNLMVRNNPSLMSGSFSLLVNNPRVLDFDNKRNYFNQQLHRRLHSREHFGTLQLNVRRARVFEDSFQYLQRKTGEQIKYGKLSVRFYDEEGVDAGGVTREWFQILARQMFDPNNALFQPCAADRLTYQPNKNSWVNPEHLSFFKFVGRVIGKAIYDGRLLDAYFARSIYRQLLGKPVDYKDVEWVDPEYYKSLCWILENDPTLLDLTFSVEADEFGVNRIVPLKEGGENIPVTQDNKREFVQLSARYRLYSSIKEQIESFSAGFYEIIPRDLITIFNEQELELLISGTPDIDVDEWRAATEYNGYTSSDPNIVWWWRALKSFNRDERAKVLSFATGTSRVPLGGFVELQGVQGVQRFSIHRAYGEPDRLPQAHTCFNQIDLPQYTSYEMLRQQLLMAINEGGEGFAFS